jgi:hypothetical protein
VGPIRESKGVRWEIIGNTKNGMRLCVEYSPANSDKGIMYKGIKVEVMGK